MELTERGRDRDRETFRETEVKRRGTDTERETVVMICTDRLTSHHKR